MTVIQLLLVLFAAYALFRAFWRWRRGGLPLAHLLAWTAFWIAVAVIVLRPETATVLARTLGVGRGADVVVYLALAAVFYLLFKMFAKIEDVERQLTRIVRDLALKDLNDDPHERKPQ